MLHRQRVGAPISSDIVGRAVDTALLRAGMDAPMRGANLLRHSLATDLLGRGAGLREIADLFGHASVATTRIYAAVDVAALRQVALPWPQARAGLPLCGAGARAAGLRATPGPGRASGVDPAGGEPGLGDVDRLARPAQPGPPPGHGAWVSAAPVRDRRRDRGARAGTARPGREIAELLQAATGLAPAGGLRPHCYAVLLGLIACTRACGSAKRWP